MGAFSGKRVSIVQFTRPFRPTPRTRTLSPSESRLTQTRLAKKELEGGVADELDHQTDHRRSINLTIKFDHQFDYQIGHSI